MNDAKLTEVIGKGNYDMFHWGWTPFVDPDPMLSYFVCDQLSKDPDNPTNYYNDANWCDPEYDRLTRSRRSSSTPTGGMELIHEMLTIFHDSATYNVLFLQPRPAGVPHRPVHGLAPAAGGDRARCSSRTRRRPTRTSSRLRDRAEAAAAGGGEDDSGMSTGALVALGVGVLAAAAIAVWLLRRRRTADERE